MFRQMVQSPFQCFRFQNGVVYHKAVALLSCRKMIITADGLDPDTGGELSAPVKKDDKIATVEVWYRNSCLMEAELFAMNDVKAVEDAAKVQSLVTTTDEGMGNVMSIIGTVCVVILGGFGVYLIYGNLRRAMIRRQRRRRRANRRRSY